MTGRQRFMAVLTGSRPDRAPALNVAACAPLELQRQTGCLMPEVHHDPELLTTLCAANHEALGFDAVPFIINYFNEPAALGCALNWGSPESYPMYVSHPWRSAGSVAIPRHWLDSPPIRTNLAALRLARRRYGDRMGILGKIMGPFSLLQAMAGVEWVMEQVMDAPHRLTGLLDTAAELLVQSATVQFEAGIDALVIGEGGAGANMLSPAAYRDLLAAFHRRMLQRIPGPAILHICGDITPRLNALKTLGLAFFHFDGAIDPSVMARAAQGHFKLVGNINTTDLLRAPPAAIADQVRRCLAAGVDMIAPGCAVAPGCPVENLRMLARIASGEASAE